MPILLVRHRGVFNIARTLGPKRCRPADQSVHDLTDRQIEILQILEKAKNSLLPLREIVEKLEYPPASRTVEDDLAYLNSLNIVDLKGVGRGAKWFLVSKYH